MSKQERLGLGIVAILWLMLSVMYCVGCHAPHTASRQEVDTTQTVEAVRSAIDNTVRSVTNDIWPYVVGFLGMAGIGVTGMTGFFAWWVRFRRSASK